MREMKKGSLGMLLLHLLNERPSYGYELCVRLRERSGGTLTFEDAAIYPVLHDFQRQGLLEAYWESGSATDDHGTDLETDTGRHKGPRRRYYKVTAPGRATLRASITEWQSFSQGVARILDTSTGLITD